MCVIQKYEKVCRVGQIKQKSKNISVLQKYEEYVKYEKYEKCKKYEMYMQVWRPCIDPDSQPPTL